MKNIILTAMVALVTIVSTAQSPFDKFEEVKGVTSIVMNQKMFKLLSKVDLNSSDPEMKEYLQLINNLDNVKMYTSADQKVAADMATTMKGYMSSGNLQELMRVNDDGKNVKFYYKGDSTDDFVKEFVMFMNGDIDGETRSVFFQVTGNIDLKQISKLAQDLDFKGSEALKEVENAKKS